MLHQPRISTLFPYTTLFRSTYKLLGFRSVYSEGFFYINMASGLKAQFGDRVMALRWSRNVHDIRCGLIEKILHLREIRPNVQSLLQLPRHQLFSVADSNNLAARNQDNLLHMLIGYFAASNNRNF